MFAVINITTDKRKGFFYGIFHHFSPCVTKGLTGGIPVYEVKVPIYSSSGEKRCRKKLIAELLRDRVDRFLCSGGWSCVLSENGFEEVDSGKYLLKNLLPAVLGLCAKAGKDAEEFNIVLHSTGNSKEVKRLFEELNGIFRSVTLITDQVDKYSDIQEEIAAATGAATIVTDSFSAVADAQIIVSLSGTEELFQKGRVKSCTVIFTIDKSFKPSGYIGAPVITAFCPTLPEEQRSLCMGAITPWELAAALEFDEQLSDKEIKEYYSFGRTVSDSSLTQDLVRKIKLQKQKNEEQKEIAEVEENFTNKNR